MIYITENNCRCYGVTYKNNGRVKVQKFKNISKDENTIQCVKPMRPFLGKSQVCNITLFSGALNKSVFDGNIILLKLSEEKGRNKYVYIGGDMVFSFMTSGNICDFVPNMAINLCPYSVATGEKNYYLLAPNFKFNKKDKVDYDAILNGMYPCERESFKELELYKFRSNYDWKNYAQFSHMLRKYL